MDTYFNYLVEHSIGWPNKFWYICLLEVDFVASIHAYNKAIGLMKLCLEIGIIQISITVQYDIIMSFV